MRASRWVLALIGVGVLVARSPVVDGRDRVARVRLPPQVSLGRRIMRHQRLMQYNRLVAAALAGNAGVYLVGGSLDWWSGSLGGLRALGLAAQVNFTLAIVLRQSYAINLLAWAATRAPVTWPLRVRWALGKYYHFGGLHVGAAICGAAWYLALTAEVFRDLANGSAAVNVPGGALTALAAVTFVVMVALARPSARSRAHDRFELSHRFLGWFALVLVWSNNLVLAVEHPGRASLAATLAGAPTVWLLVATTLGAAWPWLLLRRVPISVKRPSAHAVIVHLHHDVRPGLGTARPISRHPLLGWHHFANLPAGEADPGYRMVISRAGDWTSTFIDDPPEAVWIRGVPVTGVANVRKLFRKVVFVATGSGIGPMLAHLLAGDPPCKLVWVTRNPRRTYGDGLVDEILAAQPDALVWDTDRAGKPDVLRLAYAAYVDSRAEAVICISNRNLTRRTVHGLERRGIPAFGPIWDS